MLKFSVCGRLAQRWLARLWLLVFLYFSVYILITVVWAFDYYGLLEATLRVAVASLFLARYTLPVLWRLCRVSVKAPGTWRMTVADTLMAILIVAVVSAVHLAILAVGSGKF
jgi:hypothetical protein